MKKIIFVLTITFLISSFAIGQQKFYESAWIDKEKEMVLITIVKENGDFWLNGYQGKYKISMDKNSHVNIKGKVYPVSIDWQRGLLLFGKSEFIPEFKSRKRQFSGRWMGEDKETIFDIKLSNGGVIWDIIKDDNKPIRYYPKLTETGFTFSYGDEQLFFNMEDNLMIDSKGNKYIRIARI